MSIVADATPPQAVLGEAVFAALCLVVAVPLVVRLVSRGKLDHPERLPPGGSAWPMVAALAWGLIVWMAVPAAYVAWRGPALTAGTAPASVSTRPATEPATQPLARPAAGASTRASADESTVWSAPPSSPPITSEVARELAKPASPPDGTLDLAGLPPRDVAFLASVPHLAAFLALVTFDLAIFGGHLGRLGFSRRQARPGLAGGVKMSGAFIPLVFGGAVLTDWFYRWVGYQHPREHDLLRVMGRSAEPVVRVALAAGAVLIAPLSEELLFRGHAQTILRRGLARLAGHGDAAPEGQSPTAPPIWATWGAIVLASAVFAAVHDPWTWPAIFLLSLCLGWAYERTGNLWAPVAVHAAFNAVSTLIFLASAGAG